jgi:hypothetical protein
MTVFAGNESSQYAGSASIHVTQQAALPHPSQKLFFIRAHLAYQRLIAGIFVGGCPEHHLRKD